MHQQAGACVDFDNGTTLCRQGLRNILRHQIDARDVQANDACSQNGQCGHIGVNLIGHVQCHVAGTHDQNCAVFFRHAVGCQALTLELEH